jgi:hypothetical protein
MNRALKTAHDAFYRLEATVRARLKCWLVQVFRNKMKVGERRTRRATSGAKPFCPPFAGRAA